MDTKLLPSQGFIVKKELKITQWSISLLLALEKPNPTKVESDVSLLQEEDGNSVPPAGSRYLPLRSAVVAGYL